MEQVEKLPGTPIRCPGPPPPPSQASRVCATAETSSRLGWGRVAGEMAARADPVWGSSPAPESSFRGPECPK